MIKSWKIHLVRNTSVPIPPAPLIIQSQAFSGSPILSNAEPKRNCLEWQLKSHQVLRSRTYSWICICWQAVSKKAEKETIFSNKLFEQKTKYTKALKKLQSKDFGLLFTWLTYDLLILKYEFCKKLLLTKSAF